MRLGLLLAISLGACGAPASLSGPRAFPVNAALGVVNSSFTLAPPGSVTIYLVEYSPPVASACTHLFALAVSAPQVPAESAMLTIVPAEDALRERKTVARAPRVWRGPSKKERDDGSASRGRAGVTWRVPVRVGVLRSRTSGVRDLADPSPTP